jgi:hypothetical protein
MGPGVIANFSPASPRAPSASALPSACTPCVWTAAKATTVVASTSSPHNTKNADGNASSPHDLARGGAAVKFRISNTVLNGDQMPACRC